MRAEKAVVDGYVHTALVQHVNRAHGPVVIKIIVIVLVVLNVHQVNNETVVDVRGKHVLMVVNGDRVSAQVYAHQVLRAALHAVLANARELKQELVKAIAGGDCMEIAVQREYGVKQTTEIQEIAVASAAYATNRGHIPFIIPIAMHTARVLKTAQAMGIVFVIQMELLAVNVEHVLMGVVLAKAFVHQEPQNPALAHKGVHIQ